MAELEATVKVKLDTDQAKAELQGFTKEGRATADRINEDVSGKRGRGGLGGGLGLGIGVGLGVQAARSVAGGLTAGFGDVFGELTSPFRAQADAFIGGPEARARARARQETTALFNRQVGESNNTDAAKQHFNNILESRIRAEELGASRINEALGGGRGVDSNGEGAIDKVINPIVTAIKEGFTDIISAVGGTGGGGR
jgi:hypothetical protein